MIAGELAAQLDEWLGSGWAAEPLAGDASVRAYARISDAQGRTFMAAYYPEEVRAQLARFVATYLAIAPYAPLPRVDRTGSSVILQEDAGDETIFDVLHRDREAGLLLYSQAVEIAASLHGAPDPGINPSFTEESFLSELEMTLEFYVDALLEAPRGFAADLHPVLKRLSVACARHPYVLSHRDYHGQNLHVLNTKVFVIDYQDARMGPDTYDLASLLRDRGVARIIGREEELALVDRYAAAAGAEGDVRARYFETLLQRSVKILGTFAKIPIVRGRFHYLDFVAPARESVERCLEELPQYSELRALADLDFDPGRARRRAGELHEKSLRHSG